MRCGAASVTEIFASRKNASRRKRSGHGERRWGVSTTITESDILNVLFTSNVPLKFRDIARAIRPDPLNYPAALVEEELRKLDRQLQRLRRAGIIRYQPLSPGSGFSKPGWVKV